MLNRGNAQNHSDIETRKAMRGRIALQKHSVRNMEALFLVSRSFGSARASSRRFCWRGWSPPRILSNARLKRTFSRLLGGNLNSWGDAPS